MHIVAGDIGGTHARFAIAEIAGGKVISLADPVVLRTSEYGGLPKAWAAFAAAHGNDLPRMASFGVAGPINGGPVRFVNSRWVVDPETLAADLGLDKFLLLNDFGAMAHAVNALPPDQFVHVCGPDVPLPERGAISVIGPGTGLGVAVLQRLERGTQVLETEGAHIHFAPLNDMQRRVCDALMAQYGRVSVERVVSGPGLGAIARALAPGETRSDAELWAAAAEGSEPALHSALGLFLECYGAAVGDLSLAHGAFGIALTGGLTGRLRAQIAVSGFHAALCNKGRYRTRMDSIPVKLVIHPQPGLFGAAAAFAEELFR